MRVLKEEEWYSTIDISIHIIHWSEKIQKVGGVTKQSNTP